MHKVMWIQEFYTITYTHAKHTHTWHTHAHTHAHACTHNKELGHSKPAPPHLVFPSALTWQDQKEHTSHKLRKINTFSSKTQQSQPQSQLHTTCTQTTKHSKKDSTKQKLKKNVLTLLSYFPPFSLWRPVPSFSSAGSCPLNLWSK